MNITVEADYTKYTEIKTADAMVELLNKKDAINGKYCLGANIDLGGMQVNGRANNSILSELLMEEDIHSLTLW